MTDPTPGSRETLDPALIERCARAGFEKWHPGWPTGAWSDTTQAYRDGWRDVARAVLSEAAAQPPAPITAEDVRAAEAAWLDGSRGDEAVRMNHAAFVADYLNRRRP